jgi:biotin carboxyl carrier protein
MNHIVNGRIDFDSKVLSNGTVLNQEGNSYRFLYKDKLYDISIMSYEANEKTYCLKINGYNTKVKETNELDVLIAKLGFNRPPKKELKEIIAPMPGLVKEVFVKEGDVIKNGDNLFILEAMKMENIIKSSGEGILSMVLVVKGEKVEKGSILAKL